MIDESEVFFVIRVFRRDGTRGYIMETKDGIMVIGTLTADVKQFPTQREARAFIKDNRINANGTRTIVFSNRDLFDEKGASAMIIPMYFVTNEAEEKIFYNTVNQGYYFDKKEVGFCVWDNKDEVASFIKAMQFPFTVFINIIQKQ